MFAMFMAAALVAQTGEVPAMSEDVKLLLETIEAIQEPIDDYRCEYEGSFQAMGPVAKAFKVDNGAAYDTFSGTHIENRVGDIREESLHRLATGTITRESLVVRKREGQAEEYSRPNDAPIGFAVIMKPKEIAAGKVGSLGHLMLLEDMKRTIADTVTFRSSVIDGELDSRPVKVVVAALVIVASDSSKDMLLHRYYVDLGRGGHVIRHVSYSKDEVVTGQVDVKLSPFRVGSKNVWMPVSAERLGYAAVEDTKPYVTKEPTSRETIVVVGGTMVFNEHPGRETFTIDYKPGTPVSDRLRKMTTEFGQQKISLKPTKAEAEAMLNEELAKAEAQKRELVAVSSEGVDWAKWLPLVGIIAVGASFIGLWRQRRRP